MFYIILFNLEWDISNNVAVRQTSLIASKATQCMHMIEGF